MRISVLGSTGAMGGLVIRSALREGFELSKKISSKDRISDLFIDTDVIVDFSCPVATESMLQYVSKEKIEIPLVIGTTGLSERCMELMERCSEYTQVFYSPNMSFLISIVNMMAYATAKLLDRSYDVEIAEVHPKLKKDAHSGTAIMLANRHTQ